jgi:hypothetical protein
MTTVDARVFSWPPPEVFFQFPAWLDRFVGAGVRDTVVVPGGSARRNEARRALLCLVGRPGERRARHPHPRSHRGRAGRPPRRRRDRCRRDHRKARSIERLLVRDETA